MDIGEFIDIMTDSYTLMDEFTSTENWKEESDLYNACKFCGYQTKHIPIIDFMSYIDNEIARHLYDRHFREVVKRIYEYKSEKIANKEGPAKLR